MKREKLTKMILSQCDKFGSQAAFAREIGISRDYLNLVIHEKRNPPARLLAYLSLKPVVYYEKI
jgi:DNA-binding transcriptional regulator YdaS (Cro superfamily)